MDAPFWSTPKPLVERMLDLSGLGPGELLIDLGCGDGRIPIAAARRGARALGVDIDSARIAEAEAAAARAGVAGRAVFRNEDLFATRLDEADVVTLYLLPLLNLLLRPRLVAELRPGSRVLSHDFPMPDWEAAAHDVLDGRRIFLWIVPAVAGGT
ncbi:MAG TPA: methyltransferase domain-containing protein [Allosphingosinicella sp.]|nr:methyltransferase domain-containing protein [Allosphingosinicella sp.]